ncbi:hypothetical protein HMPREF0880_00338 [Yokenella regensburgei ATCC 43003]|jgi:hypothetical protein|nr:hypothetical protein HMPREF0880_00338 [Yokenella regensburgei ATCC 43003]
MSFYTTGDAVCLHFSALSGWCWAEIAQKLSLDHINENKFHIVFSIT